MKATALPSDQQIGAAAEGADVIVGSGDVYDVGFFLSAWVVEEEGANTLSGNHIRSAISVSSCALAHSANALRPPPAPLSLFSALPGR